MGDQDRRAAVHQLLHLAPHVVVGLDVQAGHRLIEDEDAGVAQDHPGDRQPLPLPTRQGGAPLADDRVVAVGEADDVVVDLRLTGSGLDLGVGSVETAVGDVRPDRRGEQEGFLQDEPDLGTNRVAIERAHIVAVEGDHTGVGMVEPGDQADEGALADAGLTDDSDALPRLDPEVDAAEHRRRLARSVG